MQEAFANLFNNTNSSQTWALLILLGISFLLGILLWALLMHWPAARKARKEIESLEDKNQSLEKANKDFSQRNTVLEADLKRSNESLETTVANLKEKTEKAANLTQKLDKTTEQLILYKDNARSYKENYEELMGNYQIIVQKYDKAKEQLESLKAIIEEVEKEKEQLTNDKNKATTSLDRLEEREKELTQKLVKATENIELLKKDLDEAMTQKATLKKMVFEAEANNNLSGSDDEELKEKVVRLQSHVKDLETENNDLLQQLMPFVNAQKQAEKEEAELEEKMVESLAEVEVNMNNDGFFVDYPRYELIKDEAYLKETLEKEIIAVEEHPNQQEVDEIEISEEELNRMLASENMAEEAMNLQGFYDEIQEEVLIKQPLDDIDQLEDEDEQLEQRLTSTQKMLESNPLYQEEIPRELLVADEALLKQNLDAIEVSEKEEEDEQPFELDLDVQIDQEEHQEMEKLLALADQTMEMGGLFSPIDEDQLIEAEQSEVVVANQKMYTSELEQLVVAEIGKSIPSASAEQKDDLKKIDGIGMFVEEQLNHFGIYTFEQIEAFDTDFINKLTAAIGFSSETIYRDKWVEQAKQILQANKN